MILSGKKIIHEVTKEQRSAVQWQYDTVGRWHVPREAGVSCGMRLV